MVALFAKNIYEVLLILLLSIGLFCCTKKINKVYYSTEIVCPDGARILVRYARADEMRAAMIKADADKKFYRTSDIHTIIRLPGNRSFRIERIPPEQIVQCTLNERIMTKVDKNYIKYY